MHINVLLSFLGLYYADFREAFFPVYKSIKTLEIMVLTMVLYSSIEIEGLLRDTQSLFISASQKQYPIPVEIVVKSEKVRSNMI